MFIIPAAAALLGELSEVVSLRYIIQAALGEHAQHTVPREFVEHFGFLNFE